MSTNFHTYTTQLKTWPWEVYDCMQELDMHVLVDGKQNRYDINWNPSQLQNAVYNLDLSKCDLKGLYELLNGKGIDATLLVTSEDTASWTNYTQQYPLRDVVNTKVLQFRPKQRISAHEGLIIRVRIVVSGISIMSEEPIQKYSVLDEKIFNLHIDTFASEFDVRLVDSVYGDATYIVRRQSGSNALTQPTQECVYVEFDRNAYNKYLTVLTSPVGKALTAMIVSDILSEIAYSCIDDLDQEDIEITSLEVDESSMVGKMIHTFGYSNLSEFRNDLIDNPNSIRHRSRRLMKITNKLLSI